MYRASKQVNANRRERHYLEGVNKLHDQNRDKVKIKPDKNPFRLDIGKESATLNCLVCHEKLRFEGEFNRAKNQAEIDKFKEIHSKHETAK